MYKILELVSARDNNESLYKFKETEVELSTDAILDVYVEDLLNNKGYAKSDFLVVSIRDYDVTANINDNTSNGETSDTNGAEP